MCVCGVYSEDNLNIVQQFALHFEGLMGEEIAQNSHHHRFESFSRRSWIVRGSSEEASQNQITSFIRSLAYIPSKGDLEIHCLVCISSYLEDYATIP